MKAAKKLGFDKVHSHKTKDGKNVFMPGPNHQALMKKLKEKGQTKEKSDSKKGLWENIRDKSEEKERIIVQQNLEKKTVLKKRLGIKPKV